MMFWFGIAWLVAVTYRYFRLIVNLVAFWTFKPIPLPQNPTYDSGDVTIILPTLFDPSSLDELKRTIVSILRTDPAEILISTVTSSLPTAVRFLNDLKCDKIRLLHVPHANKRVQLCEAIPAVTTPISILVDDDVTWPSTLLPWILAPFEDASIGGSGTSQRLHRAEKPTCSQRLWNFLGAIYLERRNFDIAACTHMDGGVPCMSGRTVAYRTRILQDPAFLYGFTHETWRTYLLNADDDNFMTRWLVNNHWKTYIQYHKQAELRTTLEDNHRFWYQCLRWSRSNWRSNWKSMFLEREIWFQQPWSTYAVHMTTITAWAIVWDPLMVYLLYKATQDWTVAHQQVALGLFVGWILFSKTVKLLGHFVRYPADCFLLPISWAFGYVHSLIKLWAMFTLHETAWGSRPTADTGDNARMIPLPRYEASPQSSSNSPLLAASKLGAAGGGDDGCSSSDGGNDDEETHAVRLASNVSDWDELPPAWTPSAGAVGGGPDARVGVECC